MFRVWCKAYIHKIETEIIKYESKEIWTSILHDLVSIKSRKIETN